MDKLPLYLTPDEVAALIAHARHPLAELLMLLQWRAGLRVSEALSLRPQDVDLAEGMIRLTGKGGRERLVPLHPTLAVPWRIHSHGIQRGRPVIVATRQAAWQWVKAAWASAVAAGDIDPRGRSPGTHTLRHSAARHWLSSSIPINRVSLWLGHSSIQTTLLYLRLLPDPGDSMAEVP